MDKKQPIGFFDSGLGGLSVLAFAQSALPQEDFLYLGDSANAPYGTKSDEEVRELTKAAVSQMAEIGIKSLVVACNTATGVAIEELRETHPFPIIGLEPALKMAADTHHKGLILVLATPLTLQSAKYAALYEKYGENALSLPCPGLMDFVEQEDLDSAALHQYLDDLFKPFENTAIDSVVLGCTHYVFLKNAISAHLQKETRILDSNEGVCRQLIKRLSDKGLLNDSTAPGQTRFISTGGQKKTEQMQRMLEKAQSVLGLSSK